MRKIDQYTSTIDTIYPNGCEGEIRLRATGDKVHPASRMKTPRGYLGAAFQRLRLWHMKRAGRLALRELSDEHLRDIGITRQQAKDEVAKSYFPSWPSQPL